MLGRILAICLALMSACYSPPQPDCGFTCGPGRTCPADYSCAPDGVCHRDGTPSSLVCMVDARVDAPRPIDAPPPDADVTPPAVFQTMPAAGATNVPVSTTIRVQFTEAVFGVDLTTFVVSGTGVTGGTVSQVDPLDYTYTPDAALPPDTLISVELRSGIHDAAGNSLAFTGFNFQTAP